MLTGRFRLLCICPRCYGANWCASGFACCGVFGFGLGCVDCVLGDCFVSCLIVLFSLLCFSLVVLFVYVRL